MSSQNNLGGTSGTGNISGGNGGNNISNSRVTNRSRSKYNSNNSYDV